MDLPGPLHESRSSWSSSAAPLHRPLVPGVPGLPLVLPGHTHALTLVPPRFCPAARGLAGQARVAVAAAQVPPQLGRPPQQTRLARHRDPLAPLPRQVPGAAEPGGAVPGPDAAGHLRR